MLRAVSHRAVRSAPGDRLLLCGLSAVAPRGDGFRENVGETATGIPD